MLFNQMNKEIFNIMGWILWVLLIPAMIVIFIAYNINNIVKKWADK